MTGTAAVTEEAAPFVAMSMAERWEATKRCCEAASAMVRFYRDSGAALMHRDPLPESSLRVLARLRRSEAGT